MAMIALVLGIASVHPWLPGNRIRSVEGIDPKMWVSSYHYAWFISFGVAFVVYLLLMCVVGAKIEKVARV